MAGPSSVKRSSPPEEAPLSIPEMVLANRPWRLVSDLSTVIVATLATAFLVVNSSVWPIADQLELAIARLVLLGALSIAALAVWLVVAVTTTTARRPPSCSSRR